VEKESKAAAGPIKKTKKPSKDFNIDSFGQDYSEKDLDELVKASQIANLEEQVLKNDGIRYTNETKKIELEKKAKNIIDLSLAEFLYFGYMEKIGIEILMMTKKLRDKIEVKVQDNDAAGILKLIDREHETILREVKKAQVDDLEKWRRDG
jgi:hypothetical protein